MKTTYLLGFLLIAAPLAGLRGQTADPNAPGAPDSAAPAAQPLPHMPTGFNHKPSATPPPSELAVPIGKFFTGLKGGDYAGAYETFLSGSRLGAQKEKMSVFISKTQEAFGLYGALTDYELYDNYSIGSNVIVLTYLSRHSVQPLRWRFIFYRPQKIWGVINMGFDDVLLDMLE